MLPITLTLSLTITITLTLTHHCAIIYSIPRPQHGKYVKLIIQAINRTYTGAWANVSIKPNTNSNPNLNLKPNPTLTLSLTLTITQFVPLIYSFPRPQQGDRYMGSGEDRPLASACMGN